ncbi:hypoxanthine phosphoribosyltransferase [Nostoc sp. 3335mG]|nr:hypoxanthine phosphoribosyltransferase [Nostoc sp. 3335mG]
MTDVPKTYLTADDLLADSWRLANLVLRSGFRPTHIVGIWRGGAPVGIAVQELLAYRGVESDHIAIRTSAYAGIDRKKGSIRVYSLSYLVKTLDAADRLLIVDDVFDTGRSIEAFIDALASRCRRNMPEEVKVATVYFKPRRNETDRRPDFFVRETEDWLVFPHELTGLSTDEIRANKPGAAIILGEA